VTLAVRFADPCLAQSEPIKITVETTAPEIVARLDKSGASQSMGYINADAGPFVVQVRYNNGSPIAGVQLRCEAPDPATVGLQLIGIDKDGNQLETGNPLVVVTDDDGLARVLMQGTSYPGDYQVRCEHNSTEPKSQVFPIKVIDPWEIGKIRGIALVGGTDVTSGNHFLEVDDLSLPLSNWGFKWTRYYNSRDFMPRPLGVGWSHRYDIRVVPLRTGYRVVWGDGHSDLYSCDSLCTAPGTWNKLSAKSGMSGGWVLSTQDGDLEFDRYGFITRGWGLTFEYDAPGSNQKLIEINGGGISANLRYVEKAGSFYIEQVDAVGGGEHQSVDYDYTTKHNGQATLAFLRSADASRIPGSSSFSYDTAINVGTHNHYPLSSSSTPYDGHTTYSYYAAASQIRVLSVVNTRGDKTTTTSFPTWGTQVTITRVRRNGDGDVEESTTEVTGNATTRRRIESRTDANGHTTQYQWDDYNRLQTTSDAAGVTVRRTYDGDSDRVETETRGGKQRLTYHYGFSDHRLTSVVDQLGNTTSYDYDYGVREDGTFGTKVTVTTDPGNHVSYRYLDVDGRVFKEKDALGNTTSMEYDLRGNLRTRTDSRLHATEYFYDSWDRMYHEETAFTQEGQSNKRVTDHGYDGVGNRVRSIDEAGNATTYVYDGGNRLIKEIDQFNKLVKEYERDDAGWVESSWDLQRNRTDYTYEANGWVETETREPLPGTVLTTTYDTYDSRGNVLTWHDPGNHLWTKTYDAAGRLETVKDPTDRVTKYTYYADGDLEAEYALVAGQPLLRVRYDTNEAGWVTREGRPHLSEQDLKWTRYLYDTRGNRTHSIDPLNNDTKYVYSAENLLLQEVDPFDEVRREFTYYSAGDPDGGLVKTEKDYYGRTTRTTYGVRHRVANRWDPHHIATSYGYDELSRVTSETRAGITLTYGYDANGNRISVTDGNDHKRGYVHDEANRLQIEYVKLDAASGYTADGGLPEPGKILRSLTYDQFGRVWTETDADGFTTTSTYYFNDLPLKKELEDGSYEEYAYAPSGIKTSSRRTNGSWKPADGGAANILVTTYDLDAVRQLQVTGVRHPDGRSEAYSYTARNEVLLHTDRDGVTDWYAYDNQHRVIKQWKELSSALIPADCVVEPIPGSGGKQGIRLAQKTYNGAGDVVAEANSSQISRGLEVTYYYSGDSENDNSTTAVLLDLKQDRAGPEPSDLIRSRRYFYYPNTDRVQEERIDLPANSGYESRPGKIPTEQSLRLAEYTYDDVGNVVTVRDGDDRVAEYAYDELNRKADEWRYLQGEAGSESNHTRSWSYDGRGHTTRETLHGINDGSIASVTTHQYADPRGGKTRTDYPDNTFEEWRYDPAGNLTRHLDPNGRIAWALPDAIDRPWKTIQVLGSASGYLGQGYTAESTDDGTGIVVSTREYDAAGDLRFETDGRGTQTGYVYTDGYHRPNEKRVSWTHRLANQTDVTEDAVWAYTYDALGKPAVTTDPAGHTTVVQYDGEGRERASLKLRDASSGYPSNGTLYDTYTGFLFAQANYDALGRKVWEADGRGIESAASFDALDRVRMQYHGGNRAGSIPGTRTASFIYEAGGNKLWSLGAESGYDRTYAYDTRGYLSAETGYPGKNYPSGPLAVRTSHADRQGNILWEKDAGWDSNALTPDENEVRHTYDLRSRAIEQRVITGAPTPLTTHITYDGLGNKTSETTPLGHLTQWLYDEFNKVAQVIAPATTGTAVTNYFYDPNGNLRMIRDAGYVSDATGHFSVFTYDKFNNRITADRAAGDSRVIGETAGYDGAGNLRWKKDGAGRQVAYTYDEFNRPKLEIRGLPASPVTDIDYLAAIATAYDGNGNAVSTTETLQTSGSASHDRAVGRIFDTFNRLTSETADARATSWGYDNDGRRTDMTYPDGRLLAYTYDGLGNLLKMSDSVASNTITDYTRYANGLVDVIRHPNGATEDWGYKQGTKEAESLVIKNASQATIRSAAYTYNEDGNRTVEIDQRTGQATITRSNTYDSAGRLETVTEGSKVTVYVYDKLGNRTHETVTDAATQVTSLAATFNGAGEVTAIGGTKESVAYSAAFTYDAAGNLTERTEAGTGTRNMSYDLAGQMVQVSGGATTPKYLYNADGRRTVVKEGGITREYIYDGRSLLLEYSTGLLERRYLYADRLVGLATTAEYAVHLDPLGSTLEITGSTGQRYNSNAYDPWGGVETTDENGAAVPSVSKLLYTGHQQDATGLIYFGARYYDPALARFLSADPYEGELTTPPSLNKYLYAYANPYMFVDLEGYAATIAGDQVANYYLGLDVDKTEWEFTQQYAQATGQSTEQRGSQGPDALRGLYRDFAAAGVTKKNAQDRAFMLVEKDDDSASLQAHLSKELGEDYRKELETNPRLQSAIQDRLGQARAGELVDISALWNFAVESAKTRIADSSTTYRYSRQEKGQVPVFSKWINDYIENKGLWTDSKAPPRLQQQAGRGLLLAAARDAALFVPAVWGRIAGVFGKGVAAEGVAARTNYDAYEVFSEQTITGSSRSAHRLAANKGLLQRLESNADLARMYEEQFGTDVIGHMRSGAGGSLRNPPGAVWHHPGDNPRVLQLLLKGEHTDLALQELLHRDGIGGFGTFYGGP
jgi:RHS repeat-associated protein